MIIITFLQYFTYLTEACIIDTLNIVGKNYTTLLYYKDKDKEAKGCTVDLLTDKKDKIVFLAALRHYDVNGISSCLKKDDINSNVLPFAYSLTISLLSLLFWLLL
uniref:Uncharacterized protein n=1 Tax=Meloidogyne enterolobii TaxID=390850 RepID=A0A6V7VCM4_MELEN|nr:unnamed protein product [Meloidogyne enterolobii]